MHADYLLVLSPNFASFVDSAWVCLHQNPTKVPVQGCGPGSSSERTRTAITAALRKKLKDLMGEFQDLRQRLQEEYRLACNSAVPLSQLPSTVPGMIKRIIDTPACGRLPRCFWGKPKTAVEKWREGNHARTSFGCGHVQGGFTRGVNKSSSVLSLK